MAQWHELAQAGRVDELFESVMVTHYDPCYTRSTRRNYGEREEAMTLSLASLGSQALAQATEGLRQP